MSEVGAVDIRETVFLDKEKAVKSAESKVTDLFWGEPMFSHGFLRTGPHYDKGLHALAPNPNDVDTSIDRLTGILDKGLLSSDFAKRIGAKTSRNWSDPENDKHISLTDNYQAGFLDTFDLVKGWGEGKIPDFENDFFVLLISGDIAVQKDDLNTPFNRSKLRKFRVSPKNFRGLVVNSDDINNPISEKVSREILSVFAGREELAIPIYDKKGDLCWPEKIPYQGIKEYIKLHQEEESKNEI